MPNNKELYKVTVSSPIYKTIGDYLSSESSPARKYGDNPEGFLNIVSPDDGLTNRQRLENILKKNPATKKLIGSDANHLPMKTGIMFYLEYDKVNYQSFLTEGIEVVSYDTVAFKAAQLAKLEADKGYVQVNKPIDGQTQKGSSKAMFPDCTVWIWCRALSPKTDAGNELTGQFFDLTPFIQGAITNMGKNGGNFQITLPPLMCEYDSVNGYWTLNKRTFTQYAAIDNNLNNLGYVSEGSLYDNKLNRNEFLFKNIISQNDLIFIRFETLHLEKKDRYKDANMPIIDKSLLAGKIYDMIGLIDTTLMSTNPTNNDVSINITGRDLSKLFIEDGTYFYGLENSNGQLKIAGQSSLKNSLLNRIFGEGALDFLSLYMYTSVEYIIKFIIDQLSNIKIVPDNLFTSYGDRRNNKFNVGANFNKDVNNTNYKPEIKKELASGIWQIVKLVIDENVLGRLLQDTSFSTAQGSLLNFIRTACQEPLIQFYMDTYGDQYHLIIRKPPYDRKSLLSLIEGNVSTEEGVPDTPPAIIDIYDSDVLHENLSMNDGEVYSWYSFFPKNMFGDSSTSLSLSYLGALYFEEYAQVFGSKPFQQVHPYMPFVPTNENSKGLQLYEQQASEDYKYLVESTQYLPFTRKGTIVLNGDRRLKIGNIIRYKPTGEIFFIDSVQQNIQINNDTIDRTTTIQVSRGMVEQFIYGIHLGAEDDSSKRIYVSYFNLINTELNLNKYKEVEESVFDKKEVYRTVSSDEFEPGFGEYLVHQQGPRGARQIADYIKSGGKSRISQDIQSNMFGGVNKKGNVGDDYVGAQDARGFYNYWVKKYNAAYKNVNSAFNVFSNQYIYQTVSMQTGVPVEIMKTFAMIESGNRQRIGKSQYIGIMQVSQEEGAQFGLNVKDEFENIKTMALLYNKRYKPNNPFNGINGKTQQVKSYEQVERKVKVKALDLDAVFGNFKVNKYTFNFFLKNLQFQSEFREVRTKQVCRTNQSGTSYSESQLPTVTSKKR